MTTSPTHDALQTARAYHDAWTSRDFPRATGLLSGDLAVEVPINDYPTLESFAEALRGFGSMVERTRLLSALANDSEATLIYDMDVAGLGTIRIAEHFTVHEGKIDRLRQIHDTTLIRQAGVGPAAVAPSDPYTAQVACHASSQTTFRALTTLEGLRGWWTPEVTGQPSVGHELDFHFAGVEESIRMHVDAAEPSHSLTWTCLEHSGAREWSGSTVSFYLRADGHDRCTITLEHHGVPHELVNPGWQHFLTSLANYAATGTGNPYTTG
jgi:uncharacterized protein YndB with AHSA1/START domain